MLERIGRQWRATARVWLIKSLPVDVITAAVEPAKARQDLIQLASFAERAEPCLPAFLHILPPKREQGIARPDFDQVGDAGLGQRPHSVDKTHGIKRVVAPVSRIRWFLHLHPRDGRDPSDFRRLALHGSGDTTEPICGWPHQRRMEGMGNGQQLASNAEALKTRNE